MKFAAYLDDRCRIFDMKTQRFQRNALSRFGVKRENFEAFLWPSVIATALWTGMPTFSFRQMIGIAVGILFFVMLLVANRMSKSASKDLLVQVLLLFLLGGAIWIAGPDQAGTGSLVYSHLLIPVVAIVGTALLGAAAMAKSLCKPLRYASKYPNYLTQTELFQSRGFRLPLSLNPLARIIFGLLGAVLRPLQLLWPVAIAVLIAPPAFVTPVAFSVLAIMAAVVLLAVSDERLDNSLRLLMMRFFRNAGLGVSLLTMALAAGRLMHNTYVTTIFDAASGVEILLYLFFAYTIAWWYDYWTERLIGQQLFLLIAPGAGHDCAADYAYAGAKATSVPLENRTIELMGLGRFMAYCPNPVKPEEPYFQAWPYDDLFTVLAMTGAPGGKGEPLPQQVTQRLRAYLGYVGITAIVLFGAGGWGLHNVSKAHELCVVSTEPSTQTLASLIATHKPDPTHPVILVAASGGGTRAALFTGAVLEGISQSNPDDIVAGSGVSGGGAALAYYGARRPDLKNSKSGAWNQFFDTMEMPFIQDVIERAAEWRMVEHGRLGILLAESFERRWSLDSNRTKFGELNDFGLILNTTLAGRFDRSFLTDDENRGMTLSEVATKFFDRTRSDVAGGRLILTNLNLQSAFSAPKLPFMPDVHLPILVNDKDAPVERGAALSANFPPVFSNAAVDIDDTERYWVTDGGAADNRGLEPLLGALRDAIRHPSTETAPLPYVVIVVIDASGIDNTYQQTRGLGSALGAGSHYADQLNSEVATDLISIYHDAHQESDLKFVYVPMPEILRKSGAFGTHWMLQKYIDVSTGSEKKTFTGPEVVAALRAAYAGDQEGESSEVEDWIIASPEFKQWCKDWSLPGADPRKLPCSRVK